MTEGRRLANHLRRTISGPMWHGPALQEALQGLTAEEAASRPLAGGHSIWELVQHIAAWAEISRERLTQFLGEATSEQDWPPVNDTSAAAWQATVERLEKSFSALAEAVKVLSDDELSANLPGRDHPARAMLHGVIEHAVYHGGQIALLRKALSTG